MSIEAQASTSGIIWIGRILSGLVVAFLLFDAAIKLVPIQPVTDAMQELGFISSTQLARGLASYFWFAQYSMPSQKHHHSGPCY